MIHFEEGEKTIKVLRRHWFVMLPVILGNVVAAALPVAFFNIISSGSFLEWNVPSFLNSLSFEWSVFAYSIWLLWLWTLFFIEWTDYYLDFWVITDRRIIDVEQKGFFHREVTSFRYEQIQDITVETRGILETIFKFGDLQIQTAGHERKIVIKNASFPEDARSLILIATEKSKST